MWEIQTTYINNKTFSLLMYKIASMGLLGLIAILVIPAGTESMTNDGFNVFGKATMTYNDAFGNEMLTQSVHNQLFNQGENFILGATFKNGTTVIADNVSIGAICLYAGVDQTDENLTNTLFNTAHDTGEAGGDDALNCRTDATGGVTFANRIATVGPLTFEAGSGTDNLDATKTITGIGVCDAHASDSDVRGCTTTLFAVVDTSDVTLALGETVDITYTFNLDSDGS